MAFYSKMSLDFWDSINYVILPTFSSDHNPLLLKFGDQMSVGPKPFRFQSMWIKNDYFLLVVSLAWKIQILRNPLLQVMLQLK